MNFYHSNNFISKRKNIEAMDTADSFYLAKDHRSLSTRSNSDFLEQYGPVLSSWSSNGNLKKSMGGDGGGDDDKSIEVDAAEMDEMVEGKFGCINIEMWFARTSSNRFIPVCTYLFCFLCSYRRRF